ncbi:hypothetical protein GY45DRAFT_1021253 [Cubamyces sp. BRFM 1775]|nr:hypothetical protein GY45DRAFT_1021253 [Cubamyces sp. BRFM 1775]
MECLSSVYRQCGNVRYMYLKVRRLSVSGAEDVATLHFASSNSRAVGGAYPAPLIWSSISDFTAPFCSQTRELCRPRQRRRQLFLYEPMELPSTSDMLMTRPGERSTSEHNHDHWALTRTAASQQDSAIRQSSPWRERSRATSSSSHERRSRATCSQAVVEAVV